MTVSVVIPTYNRSLTLMRAVESVLAQTWEGWDLWVVDDGGHDDAERLVLDVAGGLPAGKVNYVRIPHSGVSTARNTGVSHSRGGRVAFLDSDDQWLPQKLECQSRAWERSPEAALVYSAEIWMRRGIRVNPPAHYRGASGRILERSIRACVISPSTAVIKRSVFESLQGFRPDYPVCEDYELWLRLCSRYSVAYVSDPLVVRYGGRPDQLSLSYPAMDYWRVRALASLAGSPRLTDLEHQALAREIVRRGRVLIKGYRSRGKRSPLAEVVNLVESVVPDFRP